MKANKQSTLPLDALDARILDLYRRNTRLSADAIGEAVGLSSTAVQRRLKRMRESGVIHAEVALVSPAALGIGLTCIVRVDLEREGPVEVDRFRARVTRSEAVRQCWHVTGESDFVLVVQVADLPAYEAFARQWLTSDDNVLGYKTEVVMGPVDC